MEDLYLAREFFRGPLKGAAVSAGAPADRPPTEDGLLVRRDKWPNTAGAEALGLDTGGRGWVEIVETAARGELDLLVVVGHDLGSIYFKLAADMALNRAKLVALGSNVNPAVARASLALPIAAFAERDGTWINCKRRLQRFRKALDPAGDSLPEWMIWKEMLGRYGAPLFAGDSESVFLAMAKAEPVFRGLSYGRIGEAGVKVRDRG